MPLSKYNHVIINHSKRNYLTLKLRPNHVDNADTMTDQLTNTLLGRRIVEAEMLADSNDGRIILDDGTILLVRPNEGCGGCSSGWYGIEKLATVDNIITSVRYETSEASEYEAPESFSIYVVASAHEVGILTVEGDEGNGYYGAGYTITATLPDQTTFCVDF